MRQRFRQLRSQQMARPRGGDRRLDLSPRARLIGGWLAALLLILVIAAAVRIFGGNADGAAPLPSASTTASGAAERLAITFGTALDTQRLVDPATATARFVSGDTFAYSVSGADPASSVYVAVRRTAGGAAEVVQEAVDEQAIPGAPANIGFTVPAANLFEAFGPGTYEMFIYLDPAAEPIAAGSFELVEPLASPSEAP
jgi:hypothetical protein